ncbi:hypothetical protein CHUAL_011922 [Chamberlinius hualienensis]
MTSEEQLADDDSEELYPVKNSLLSAFRHSANWKCLILTSLILGCLGAIAWCRLAEVTKTIVNFAHFPITKTLQSSPCEDGYIYIPIAFVITLYMVYLVECWHCSTRFDLKYSVDAGKVYEMIGNIKESLPIVWWKAICYHYVRRSRQVTRYRNGDAYTSTQVYYERINSHSASASFVFAHCGVKDISKKLVDLERYPATKIRFSKGFAFANMEAASEFEDQRVRFFQENERRDDYMEMREGLDLTNVNFKEFLIAFADPDHLPWYMSNVIFWVASFLLVSWPLRLLVESRTAYVHYQVTKLFGVNYVNSPMNNYLSNCPTANVPIPIAPTISHINRPVNNNVISPSTTITSFDLTNLSTLLPSYSEALLMDSIYPSNTNRPEGIDNDGVEVIDIQRSNRLSRARSSSHLLVCSHNGQNSQQTNLEIVQIHQQRCRGHRHSWTMYCSRGARTPYGHCGHFGTSGSCTSRLCGHCGHSGQNGNGYLGIRPSITRLSLHNGHVLYHPVALWEALPSTTSFHCHPIKLNNNNNNHNNVIQWPSSNQITSPPDYDVAIQVSRPLSSSTMQLLRRSQTEREFQLILQQQTTVTTSSEDSNSNALDNSTSTSSTTMADNNNNENDNENGSNGPNGSVRIVLDEGETAL